MRLRVLIVDDSPPVRISLQHMLAQLGVEPGDVRSAGDAQSAMAVFHELQPEVVFMDIDLDPELATTPSPVVHAPAADVGEPPRGDHMLAYVDVDPAAAGVGREPGGGAPSNDRAGTVLAQQMLAENPELKLVVCTGMDPTDSRVRKMVSWGAFDVISKPLRAVRVREVLRSIEQES